MVVQEYDFCGYATKNDLRCTDGRVIKHGAFKGNDGQTVPMVWMHQHNNVDNVLGHCVLEDRDDGTYAYGIFNDTDAGKSAKTMVMNGDIRALSIYANQLKHNGSDVIHGDIKEVSLVLAGANPGAFIESVMAHGEDEGESAIIYTGEEITVVEEIKHADDSAKEKTPKEIFNTLTDEQKNTVFFIIGTLLEKAGVDISDIKHYDDEEGESMKHNAFEGETDNTVLIHDAMTKIIEEAKNSNGKFRDSFMAHAQEYGITNISELFPDATMIRDTPDWIDKDTGWVSDFMNGTSHAPFARIKSMAADITADTARAKGYIKGNKKKEEFFAVSKRITTPTTVYKKQKFDRDDLIDVTEFSIVNWILPEMRGKLNEEIARAGLIGDGRDSEDEDKVSETNIRPIVSDDDLYNVKVDLTDISNLDTVIETIAKAKKKYKGSGAPTFYTTNALHIDMLWIKDSIGRRIYTSDAELCSALGVSKIVEVEHMEGLEVDDKQILGIIVNPKDYTYGADKGGAIENFNDFDIDFNQYKYLMETRCSGCLTKVHSAMTIRYTPSASNGVA